MRRHRPILLWSTFGLLGAMLLAWAFPRAFPLLPRRFETSESEARVIAFEAMRGLGELPARPYVVTRLRSDVQLERRLQLESSHVDAAALRQSDLSAAQLCWDVLVYPPRAAVGEWALRAFVSLEGEILMLRRNDPQGADRDLDDETALALAAAYLAGRGFDLGRLEGPGEVRRGEIGTRLELRAQFRFAEAVLGEDLPYGLEVYFAGDDVAGFGVWYEDPHRDQVEQVFRRSQILGIGNLLVLYLLLPFAAVPFFRRYHDGQLGVRRGIKLLLAVLAAGLVYTLANRHGLSENTTIGLLTRRQTTWFSVVFLQVFNYFGAAVLALMAWSAGEYLCRRRESHKLASIDALFRLRWDNATVARASLQGFAGGLLMAGLLLALTIPGQRFDVWAVSGFVYDDGLGRSLGWLGQLADAFAESVPIYLFAGFFAPCWVGERWGRKAAACAAWLGIAGLAPQVVALPLAWGWTTWAVVAAVPVVAFVTGDLLAMLLAGFTCQVALAAVPALGAEDGLVALGGWAALFFAASPLVLSLRSLLSGEEFAYAYDDVPAHVRRIAERERQRVELETAAEIQSSILPELPPELNGVEIASTYLPATEVGGDFYDVLALDDGRLAVAVGDVAGHGVSSGLVMSMAKSALAVQVTFDPEVRSVFYTLNRMVYQSARRRLLATLCYLLIDPAKRLLSYASAGHLYPYRVSLGGEVVGLETGSYPLGVRPALDVEVRTTRLGPSDALFLLSDGLVEAHPEWSDEPFGFDRLEESLRRHAGLPPQAMRDAVLGDLEAYLGRRPWEDDLTILVLRLPAE